jgi:hypothetical protein
MIHAIMPAFGMGKFGKLNPRRTSCNPRKGGCAPVIAERPDRANDAHCGQPGERA